MSLKLLPDVTFPINGRSINPLMDNLVQLNLVEGSINERQQFALGILFHTFDLYVKSGGRIDYRGKDGHSRMMADAQAYSGGSPAVTRHGDLAAAHLSVDFNDTQIRLRDASLPALPDKVSDLLVLCSDLAVFSPRQERTVLLLLDVLSKKSP